jgi:hypothetical protein
MCRLSWNLGVSTFWNPMGLSRPVMGLFCYHQFLRGAKDLTGQHITTSSVFKWGLYLWPGTWLVTELRSCFDHIWIWNIINVAAIQFYHETFPVVAAWSPSFKLRTNHFFVIHFPFTPKTSAVEMCLRRRLCVLSLINVCTRNIDEDVSTVSARWKKK